MKNAKVPRKNINAGKGDSMRNFNIKDADTPERLDYEKKIEFVKKNTPKDAFEVLENISNDYNLNYEFPRIMPWQ